MYNICNKIKVYFEKMCIENSYYHYSTALIKNIYILTFKKIF